ncbi:negative transcriptional regulator-like protein [Coleophoma cylindrospora]|uniref:Negative transcriptional regulator-like protein n=1 Tax=Coleophoma cylindrospora TaxID=1849047 RepID=A0A3D8RFZ2_9HELO|nr:negative transcriptional regulator-like protein [Coleophoma cylindrospora]
MHLPSVNVERRPEVLHKFIRANPLGILTTAIRSDSHPLIQSSHIPWVLDSSFEGSTSGLGRLRGHIARQNPQAKAIMDECAASPTASTPAYLVDDVQVLFNGPVHHYVTPKFYTQTKPATGKVVPTWDYEAVEVHGKAKVYVDGKAAASGAFLKEQLHDLSMQMETEVMGYGEMTSVTPWKVADAPEPYIELLSKNIIGIEIEITSLAGRFKWSQEKPVGDRTGVIEGFKALDTPDGVQLAEKVMERAALFDAEKAQKKQVV